MGRTPLGTFGHIGCFSTQSSKGMSAGEGGIFVTNDDEYAAKAALYAGSTRSCGRSTTASTRR